MQVPFCVACTTGVTYSSEENIGSCESCPSCHGRNVLQPCNATHPTICSDDCAEGFEMNDVVGDCQQKYQPTPSGNKMLVDEKLNKRNISRTNDSHQIVHVEKRSPTDKNGRKTKNPDRKPSEDKELKPVETIIIIAVVIVSFYAIGYLVYENRETLKSKMRRALKHRQWCSTTATVNEYEMPLQGKNFSVNNSENQIGLVPCKVYLLAGK